jgi:hypothetical protein
MDFSNRFRVNHPEVLDESVDGEVLIVNLESGAYYSSSGSGDAIWSLLAGGATIAEATDRLQLAYDVPRDALEAAVTAFLEELVGEGLLVTLDDAARAADVPSIEGLGLTFAAQVLQKYTDMQELLVLDPIHDVEPGGWPLARQADAPRQ